MSRKPKNNVIKGFLATRPVAQHGDDSFNDDITVSFLTSFVLVCYHLLVLSPLSKDLNMIRTTLSLKTF